MRLRQIALVGRDLAAARAEIEAVLGLGQPYADRGVEKYGLHNAVWAVGDTFLEVVSPTQDGTTAGRLLDKRRGDGGYMAIFQTAELEAARSRAAEAGVRIVDQIDRPRCAFTHFHPRDIGGAIVSVDWMDPPEHWEWGGPDWRANVRTDVSIGITGAELQGEDPEAMAGRWAAVLDAPVSFQGDTFTLRVDGGEIRFTPLRDDRGEGLTAFDVAVRDPADVRERARAKGALQGDDVVLCGTRVNLAAAGHA